MSSHNKLFYITPTFKEVTYRDLTKDAESLPPIIEEFGPTPDQIYLEKISPTFYQVKRKLDLQLPGNKIENPLNNKMQNPRIVQKILKNKSSPRTNQKPRYDTSLAQLTKKFVKLFSDATDGIINLNTACTLLAVPKRRLYDVTNVLEGAGLIAKKSRNNIEWMGKTSSPCASLHKYEIENEIDILEAKENKLDELIHQTNLDICAFKEENKKYQYVTTEDINNIAELSNKEIIAINILPGHVIEATERTFFVSNLETEIDASLLTSDSCFTSFVNDPNQDVSEELDSFPVNIENDLILNPLDSVKSPKLSPEKEEVESPIKINDMTEHTITTENVYTEYSEGDSTIRKAFITELDDIAPINSKHFLLQTEDQNLDEFLPFPYYEDSVDTYSFSLDDGEGLTDLYDCGKFYNSRL